MPQRWYAVNVTMTTATPTGGRPPAGTVEARTADDLPSDAAVVGNPDDEVTAETFAARLDRRQAGEPVDPGATAADTLAEIGASGEA